MVVQGKAFWASVQSPNTTYDPVYSVDLVVDLETAKRLKAEGLEVKKKKEGDKGFEAGDLVVKFKRKAFKKSGEPNSAPTVVDAKKNPFSELIGNGSVVKVSYTPFEWSYAGKSGTTGWLNAVQVIEHVPYEGGFGVDEFESEEGTDSKPELSDFDDSPFDD